MSEPSLSDVVTPANPSEQQRIERRVPPHTCLPLWIDKLFDTVRDVNPPKVTREFVAANIVGSGHQGKVLIALRFLGLIDENENMTARLRALRVVGPEFTTNLAIVVQQSYSDLLGTVALKSATFNRLINFLMQKYSMNQSQAESAARFFIHLAKRAGMEMSEELGQVSGSKQERSQEPSRKASSPVARTPASGDSSRDARMATSSSIAVIDGKFGQIRIVDRSTLELARKLLDMIEGQLKDQENSC